MRLLMLLAILLALCGCMPQEPVRLTPDAYVFAREQMDSDRRVARALERIADALDRLSPKDGAK